MAGVLVRAFGAGAERLLPFFFAAKSGEAKASRKTRSAAVTLS
jgi:hypothetical protein